MTLSMSKSQQETQDQIKNLSRDVDSLDIKTVLQVLKFHTTEAADLKLKIFKLENSRTEKEIEFDKNLEKIKLNLEELKKKIEDDENSSFSSDIPDKMKNIIKEEIMKDVRDIVRNELFKYKMPSAVIPTLWCLETLYKS